MIRLKNAILPIVVATALGLSLASCDRKLDAGKASPATADAGVAASTPATTPTATCETESEARAGPEGGPPYGPRAGMERGREGREHGTRMAPDAVAPADKPPE